MGCCYAIKITLVVRCDCDSLGSKRDDDEIFVVDVRMSWSRVKKVGGADRLQVDRSRTFVFSGSMYRSSLPTIAAFDVRTNSFS
jgi:hypothetical protein